jgi:hypothetical protein
MGSQSNDHLQTSLCTDLWSDRRRARWWASSSGRGRRRGRWEEGRTLKEVRLQYRREGNLYVGGLRERCGGGGPVIGRGQRPESKMNDFR